MVYKIVYSPLAKKTFLQNVQYLEDNWTIKEIKVFIQKVADIVAVLKYKPLVFPIWEFDKGLRKVRVLKQITMFYELDKEIVFIHLFWNNYQDPEKLKSYLEEFMD